MDKAMNNQVFKTVAIILDVAISSLDLDSSFIQNGGDSLKATSLANHFRKRGIMVTREMILTSTSLEHLISHFEYPSMGHYDVQDDSTSADSSTVLSESDWQTVSPAEQDIISSPNGSSFRAPCSNICSSSLTSGNQVFLDKESLSTYCFDQTPRAQGAQQATEMQLALVHGTLKDSRMNMIQFTMVHHNEHINILKAAWRSIVERADIFDMAWAAPLTGFQHSRFIWVDDPSEDEAKTTSIGSRFTVLSHDSNNNHFRIIWTVHHALIDGISAQLLLRNVLGVARGHAPSIMPSFWEWAQDLKTYQRDNADLAKQFWSRQKQIHPDASGTLQLPKPSTSKEPNEAKTITLPIYDVRGRLAVAAKHCNVTLATMFYAAWALVLSSFSDSKTIVFGALLSGRNIPIANSDKVIGPLINSLPLYTFVDPDVTVQQFLASLFRSLLDLEQFSWTCTDHGFSRDYESTLSVDTWQDDWSEFDLRPVATSKSQQSDVPLGITVNTESLQFQYHTDKLRTVDAERIMSCYKIALEQITRVHTPVVVAMEALVSAPSRALLAEFGNCMSGRTTRSSVSDDLVSLFSRCVERHPDSIAVDYGAVQVTYRDFDIMTTCVATRIASVISEGDIVCVHSDKSLNWIVAIFGILKAGGVYSSLDPILPSELRATMFRNAKAKLFLTPKACQLCQTPSTCDSSDSIDSILQDAPVEPPKIDRTPKPWANAYLCFTSGSTGTPKGVICTHEGLVAFQSDLEVRLFAQPGVRIAQVMSVAFDGSIHEIFSALTHGATLVLPFGADPLGALDTAHSAVLTPSIARVLNPEDYPMLKWVYLVGEPVPQTVSDRWSSIKTLYNMYGPTEGTGGATIKRLTPGDAVTIGTPNPTTRVYILNSQGKLAHHGMIGEIYIAGVQVARGYLGLDDQTRERFLPDTIMRNGETMYRTGDRGYWSETGQVCCLGRNDRQIKLRGYRLDLNDLEIRISRAAPELSGVALARKQDELVAVVQPGDVDIRLLKTKISSALPLYAIPRHLVALDKIPTTPAGKVDYRAVSAAFETVSLSRTEPLSDMQRLVSCAFCKVLGIQDPKQVTLDWDFIASGGHSLKQIHLAQILSETFKMRIPLQLILSNSSVRGLSESLQVLLDQGQSNPRAVSCATLGDRVSPIEHEWLVKYQSPRGTASFNVCFASTFSQVSVCRDRLIWAWNQVLQGHKILSSRFSLDGEASKRYFDQAPPRIQSLSDFDFWKQANRPFDLTQESPIRVFVSRDKLMVVISHVAADYTTLSLLLQDVSRLYQGHPVQKRPIYADSTSLVDASFESVVHFWRDYLRDLPQAPKLLRDSPLRTTYQGCSFSMQFDHQLWNSIKKLSAARMGSNQLLALAVVAVCLHQDASDIDTVIGVPWMHRQTEDEQQTIGLFLQPLPVRLKYSKATQNSSFLQSTQCSMQAAVAHATCWDRIVDALDVDPQYPNHPIFDVMVTFLDDRMVSQLKLDIPSFEFRYIWANGAKFKLMLEFMEIPDGSLMLRIEYDDSCISLHKVEELASRVKVTLKILLETPHMRDTVAAILPTVSSILNDRSSDKIDLATAENWLIRPELQRLCKEAIQSQLTEDHLSYAQGFGGDALLLASAADFFNTYFKPLNPVLSEHIVATPGATSCLDSLLYCICDEGDIVLVPAPYWSLLRAKVKIVPVITKYEIPVDGCNYEILDGSLLSSLNEAYQSVSDKSRVRALIMTNPHNPFAQCYHEAELREAIAFCQSNGFHYISDELYAMSDLQRMQGYGGNVRAPFVSALRLTYESPELEGQKLEPLSPSKIHIIWSLSKDFGSSGLRLGFLINQDPSCKALLASVYILSTIHASCLSSIAASHILKSTELPILLEKAATRLREAHKTAITRFHKWGAPFIYPHAGPYVTVKLVKLAKNLEEEDEGLEKLKQAGVVVSRLGSFAGWKEMSGNQNHFGWVRMTVAVPAERLLDALDRIAATFKYEEEEDRLL
ncbi:hypothetical protein FGADI_9808 [Fusarium gaditjirri]|uniref:Carrier domain-containing protein n=1 Tax=Fusarium gaditjirri TaxID=282569 RepID=A0A8H4SYY7_9HYPO|nr:hypothetical protein FGADI_9808 [Fusarium gaditjirri]